jgi:hypothetical protein
VAQPAVARGAFAPRHRVIIDNDLSGDPDGLFQLAHHLASPTSQIQLIVGSHLHDYDPFDASTTQANQAATRAREVATLMHLPRVPTIIAGRNSALGPDRSMWDSRRPRRSLPKRCAPTANCPCSIARGPA